MIARELTPRVVQPGPLRQCPHLASQALSARAAAGAQPYNGRSAARDSSDAVPGGSGVTFLDLA